MRPIRRLVRAAAALALASAVVPVATSPAHAAGTTTTVFTDDFQSGFDTSAAGKWQLWPAPGMPSGDGIPSTDANGLHVIPSGTDPATGNPAFAFTTAQQTAGGAGDRDHTKWLTFANHNSTAGFAGYDTPAAGSWTCDANLSVTTRKTGANPFGVNATDAQSDLRLANGAMVVADLETGVLMDFHVTDNTVYAWYERLRYPNTTYSAFAYAVPVATISKGASLNYRIVLDDSRTRATWMIDGIPVYSVSGLGARPADRSHLVTDHGGTDQAVAPRQLLCGLGTFTIMDGAGQDGRGLVRLDTTPGYYYAPLSGRPAPQTFVDPNSRPGDRLWGQGAEISSSYLTVTTTQ
ncbi:DUF6081 family protein [Streptomyces sp. CBMA123]|uniref:DUF6081 family protein n=1 Tax=Streptomyces sp. CBMA123 TaxID=1896313 RepID=UPI001CB8686D|nr:DUF6081 family protein [Streptomyces sp. CBMA123]